MSDKPLTIKCECLSTNYASVVCGHLVKNKNKPLGFIENSSEPDDLQGWCYACEYVYCQEEDRTEKFKSFSNSALVCSNCYARIKSIHDVSA